MANKKGYRLNSIGDVSHCLKRTINELKRGEVEIAEARTRGFLLNILLTAIKNSEIEERLIALEKAFQERNQFQN